MLYVPWRCSYSYSTAPQGTATTRSHLSNRTNSPAPSLTSRSLTYQIDNPSTPLDVVANRTGHNTYFDPSNQATIDRLIVDVPETEFEQH